MNTRQYIKSRVCGKFSAKGQLKDIERQQTYDFSGYVSKNVQVWRVKCRQYGNDSDFLWENISHITN